MLHHPDPTPVLIRRIRETREWRVAPKGAPETIAYYTDDLDDAKGTARLAWPNLPVKVRR